MIRKLALVLAALTPFLATPASSYNHHNSSQAIEFLDDEDDHRRALPAPPPAPIAQPNYAPLLRAVCATLSFFVVCEFVKSWF
jgi:hypothetical protein